MVTNIDPEHLDHWKTEEALQRRASSTSSTGSPSTAWPSSASTTRACSRSCPDVEKRFVTYGEAPQADYRADAHRGLGPRGRLRGLPARRAAGALRGGHGGAPQRAQRALGDRPGRRDGHPARGHPRRAGLLPGRAAPLHRPRRGAAASPWSTTTATTRPRCGPPCAAPARPSGGGWSASSSPTATPAPATCSRSSPPPSTTPTCCSLTDVYAAGEEPHPGRLRRRALAEAIRACGHRDVTHVPARRPGRPRRGPGCGRATSCITLGAGDVTAVGPELLGLLGSRERRAAARPTGVRRGRRRGPRASARRDEPLAPRTSIRVGGPADLLVRPADPRRPGGAAARRCASCGVPLLVLGGGANLLVADAGVRGVVVRLPVDFGEERWTGSGSCSRPAPRSPASSSARPRRRADRLRVHRRHPRHAGRRRGHERRHPHRAR